MLHESLIHAIKYFLLTLPVTSSLHDNCYHTFIHLRHIITNLPVNTQSVPAAAAVKPIAINQQHRHKVHFEAICLVVCLSVTNT